MKTATEKLWAAFDCFEISMTLEQANSASHSGRCDDDVAELLELPEISSQLDAIGPEAIRKELYQYSDWDVTQDKENRARIIWIAAGNIVEEAFHRESKS